MTLLRGGPHLSCNCSPLALRVFGLYFVLHVLVTSLSFMQQNATSHQGDKDHCVPVVSGSSSKNDTLTPQSLKLFSSQRLYDPDIPQSRTYLPWPEHQPFPCFEFQHNWKERSTHNTPTQEGFFFIREKKTGSTTLAGVVLRLLHRQARRRRQEDERSSSGAPCRTRIDHASALVLQYARRNRAKSFLMTMLREPTKRAISAYFHFRVSNAKEDPTDLNFQNWFRSTPRLSNFYTKELSMHPMEDLKNRNHTEIVQDILQSFDFIAITERLDESLVVLKMLLRLDFSDILYLNANTAGNFRTGLHRNCIYLVPSFLTPGMQEFFASDYWKNFVAIDNLLYQAALKSLDNTIDSLGRTEVKRQLNTFSQMRQMAQKQCMGEALSVCDKTGTFVGSNASCLLWDLGCGFECLDRLEREMVKAPEAW